MADPFGTLSTLWTVSKALYDMAQLAKQNKEESQKLASHALCLQDLLQKRYSTKLPAEVEGLVTSLSRYYNLFDFSLSHPIVSLIPPVRSLIGITTTMRVLESQSFLKRLLWSSDISDRIQSAYRDIENASRLFQVPYPSQSQPIHWPDQVPFRIVWNSD